MTPSACRSLPAKIAVGRLGQGEQIATVCLAAARVEVAEADPGGVDRQSGGVHRRAVAVDAGERAHHVLRAGDGRDAPMAELDQVPGGHEPARPVGRPDRRHVGRGIAGGVDDHERDAARAQLLAVRCRDVGEDEHDAHGAPAQDAVDPLGATGQWRSPLTVSTTDSPAACATSSTPSMTSIDQLASSSWKTSSTNSVRCADVAPLVAVAREVLLESRPRARRDVGAAVEHLRHRRERDAGLGGDLGECDPCRVCHGLIIRSREREFRNRCRGECRDIGAAGRGIRFCYRLSSATIPAKERHAHPHSRRQVLVRTLDRRLQRHRSVRWPDPSSPRRRARRREARRARRLRPHLPRRRPVRLRLDARLSVRIRSTGSRARSPTPA